MGLVNSGWVYVTNTASAEPPLLDNEGWPLLSKEGTVVPIRTLRFPHESPPCLRFPFYCRTRCRQLGGSDSVLAVLRDPPKKVPRSPTMVIATLAERSRLEPEEEVPSVEVRWRVPSQASLAPTLCGDIERFYVKAWCRGKGKEVIRTKTSTVNVPRRDFCRNQVNQIFGRPRKPLSIAKGIVVGPFLFECRRAPCTFVNSTRSQQSHLPTVACAPSNDISLSVHP